MTETKEIIDLTRPSWQETFMTMAETVARRSTCSKMKTGALLVRDNRVISMGYNGTIPGAKHCCDYWTSVYTNGYASRMSSKEFLENVFPQAHHDWATVNEIHGEQNAILYAAKQGISTENTEMYSLYSPCINCAKVIITAGIKKVYYRHNYRRDTRGRDFLRAKGIPCEPL